MSDVKELKRISLEFRRLASNLLGTGYETADISLYRFKEYIDNTIIIKDILQNKIKNVEIDFKECFPIESNDWCSVHIPREENKHIKAIYDLIEYIVSNNIQLLGISASYYCSSRKFVDIIQNFLNLTIKPLIDYIVDELSKQILLEEEINMPTVNLNHTQNSTVSLAFGSQQMVTSSINIENVEDIHKIIEDIKKELEIIEMDKEDKENLFDDLDVVDEQINSSVEKPTRLKKAYNNISSFLEKSTSVITKSTALALGIQKLIELVSPIIK